MLRDQLRGKTRPKAVEVECPEFPGEDGAPAKLAAEGDLGNEGEGGA